LAGHGVRRGDTVALIALNIRLDPNTIGFILRHGEAKVVITDTEFSPVIREAQAQLDEKPVVIDIVDAQGPRGDRLGRMDYEAFSRPATRNSWR
jgi:fatty-acyl-CoA synthase